MLSPSLTQQSRPPLLQNPNQPPPADKLINEYCDGPLEYLAVSSPIPTPIQIDCTLDIAPSDATADTPLFLKGTLTSPLPKSQYNIGISYEYKGQIYFSNQKPTLYNSPQERDFKDPIGTFKQGDIDITYTLIQTTLRCGGINESCTRFSQTYRDKDDETLGSCKLHLVIGDNTVGVTIIPKSPSPTDAPDCKDIQDIPL